MVDLIDLVQDHYQWVFSGVGVLLLTGAVALMRRRAPATPQPPNVSGGPRSVFSLNQSGGVTAGTYVNQAPKPQLKPISHKQTRNPDGTYTTSVLVEVVSPYPPGSLSIQASAEDILELEVMTQRSGPGMCMTGHSGRRPGFHFTTLLSPFGKYIINVRTEKATQVQFGYNFDG